MRREIKGGAAPRGDGGQIDGRERDKGRRGKNEREGENEVERARRCVGGADVPFLIPPVRGFVPRPSRKWELGRQQLTKEL